MRLPTIAPRTYAWIATISLVALVFIVFDALVLFAFPWALVLRTVGMTGFWLMALFIGIVGLGWLYAYREGILEWK